jgi:Ras-related GTP-binding protein C/D
MLSAFMGKKEIRGNNVILNLYISSAQGASPNNLSLMDPNERGADPYDTPVSLDHPSNNDNTNADSDSLERRLIEHQTQQQQQQRAFSDAEASSLIKLDNGDVLYMREVNR